jgi:hypothetical protein
MVVGLLALAPEVVAAPSRPWTPVHDARIERGLAVARAFWNREPDCKDGYRTYSAPITTPALADTPGCRMWFADYALRLPRTAKWSAALCVLVVHEYGHSLGYGHSEDRRSVMFEAPRFSSVPRCAVRMG